MPSIDPPDQEIAPGITLHAEHGADPERAAKGLARLIDEGKAAAEADRSPFPLHRSYEPDRERQVAALLILLGERPRAGEAASPPATPPSFTEEELRRRPKYRAGRRVRKEQDDAR